MMLYKKKEIIKKIGIGLKAKTKKKAKNFNNHICQKMSEK